MPDWLGYALILVFCEDFNVLGGSCTTTWWKVTLKIVVPVLLVAGVCWWARRRCRRLKGGDAISVEQL